MPLFKFPFILISHKRVETFNAEGHKQVPQLSIAFLQSYAPLISLFLYV